ncbi:MAG: FecR domain-containing protein [Desulfobacterales bacterium]|nr:FecR domain-containing protein [Desulfobacterales bacterium]
MNLRVYYRNIIITIVCLFFLTPISAKTNEDDNVRILRVQKGDSISYLSFKLYKKYNNNILNAILEYNPEIKNINLISVGQEIRFPKLEIIENFGKNIEKQITSFPPPESQQDLNSIPIKENAYITYLEGDIRVCHSGNNVFEPVEVNSNIKEGDEIQVGSQSKAEIITFDNDVIRVSENTKLKINKLENNTIQKTQKKGFFVACGRMWNQAKTLFNPNSEYVVKTPNAISGIKGTAYDINIDSSGNTKFKTYSGAVKIWKPQVESNNSGWRLKAPSPVAGPHSVSFEEWTEIILKKNQEILITNQGATKKAEFNPLMDEQTDNWIKWNKARDDEMNKMIAW